MKRKGRKKPGPKSFKSQAKLPRHASLDTKLQKARNDRRSSSSLDQLRYGFVLLWRTVPGLMRRYKIGEVGSFDKHNSHKGKCWGWKKECKLTNRQAKTLFWEVYETKTLTPTQFKVVRKALSYAYELTGGKPKTNFPGVYRISELIRALA